MRQTPAATNPKVCLMLRRAERLVSRQGRPQAPACHQIVKSGAWGYIENILIIIGATSVELNFFSATNAHKAWKKRLYDCVCGACSTLDPDAIALDNRCDLGKWLHGIREKRPALSADTQHLFTRLFDEHAAFHRAAAGVARQALANQQKEALQQLQGGEYARISNRVIGTLGELYLKRREFGMD